MAARRRPVFPVGNEAFNYIVIKKSSDLIVNFPEHGSLNILLDLALLMLLAFIRSISFSNDQEDQNCWLPYSNAS